MCDSWLSPQVMIYSGFFLLPIIMPDFLSAVAISVDQSEVQRWSVVLRSSATYTYTGCAVNLSKYKVNGQSRCLFKILVHKNMSVSKTRTTQWPWIKESRKMSMSLQICIYNLWCLNAHYAFSFPILMSQSCEKKTFKFYFSIFNV